MEFGHNFEQISKVVLAILSAFYFRSKEYLCLLVVYGNLFDALADSWDTAKGNSNVHIVFYENLKLVRARLFMTAD